MISVSMIRSRTHFDPRAFISYIQFCFVQMIEEALRIAGIKMSC